MKRIMKVLSVFMSVAFVFSVFGLNSTALALQDSEIVETKGNVPVTFIPNSEITFGSDGDYEVSHIENQAKASRITGQEIGETLADSDPEAFEEECQEALERFDNLPVYTYEQYYIAKEGAVASYDDNGELIRVRGDYEYYSTLDQYLVDGSLPDGKYVGTYLTFSRVSNSPSTSRSTASVISESGRFTTYGDYWPVIDSNKWPNCNTDPVKFVQGLPKYGDRIGTHNNKLYIGDVALKAASGVPYDAKIGVIIQNSDTNGNGNIGRTMRVRDTMDASANSVMDIWRWDNPEWFKGTPQSPNNLYFGQTYTTSRSFPNKQNTWTYNR